MGDNIVYGAGGIPMVKQPTEVKPVVKSAPVKLPSLDCSAKTTSRPSHLLFFNKGIAEILSYESCKFVPQISKSI